VPLQPPIVTLAFDQSRAKVVMMPVALNKAVVAKDR